MTMIVSECRSSSFRYGAKPRSIVPEYQAEWFAAHDRIVAPIRSYLKVFPDLCHSLVDIGAGDGAVLDDIASRLPQCKNLIGLTVDRRALNLARVRTHHDSRLSFHLANPWAWLSQEKKSQVILFSYDNLSILSDTTLENWFSELLTRGSAALALIEPRDGGCAELPSLLLRSGWEVRYAETTYRAGMIWWHVFASRRISGDLIGETL